MNRARGGFTLVELLVVVALIAIVATMAVAFFPNAATANRESNAALQVQGLLNIAKARALRNQRPTGVRFWIKQKADQFYVNANQFMNVCTEMQLIEQPDDLRGSAASMLSTVPLNTPPMMPSYKTVNDVVLINGVDFMNGYTPAYVLTKSKGGSPNMPNTPPKKAVDATQPYWTVQPCPFVQTKNPFRPLYPYVPNPAGYGGDYLEVLNNGVMHQIIAVCETTPAPTGGTQNMLQIWPPLPTPIGPTANYRIIRGPRVVGTDLVTLPDSTFIDFNTNVAYDNPLPNLANVIALTGNAEEKALEAAEAGNEGTGLGTQFIDILFSPSGQVITPGVATSNLHLWVRSPTEMDPNDPSGRAFVGAPGYGEYLGAPTIVSVYVRTGFVGAYPPAIPATYPPPAAFDPYSLVK